MYGQHLIDRFLDAQEPVFDQVINELMRGEKSGHWMWFVFPQISGLGRSEQSRFYAIADLREAREYIQPPVLKAHMLEACHVLLMRKNKPIGDMLGVVDALKLRSSMTLFELAAPEESPFTEMLNVFFEGERCQKTIELT